MTRSWEILFQWQEFSNSIEKNDKRNSYWAALQLLEIFAYDDRNDNRLKKAKIIYVQMTTS